MAVDGNWKPSFAPSFQTRSHYDNSPSKNWACGWLRPIIIIEVAARGLQCVLSRGTMKRYFNFYHYLMIIPALILYSNCDGYKSTEDSAGSLSSCTNTASLSLKLLKFDADADCNNTSLVQCDRRVFSPSQDNDQDQAEECLSDSPFGAVCIRLNEHFFNTSQASGETVDFEPGGSYNYQEYNCYMKRYSHNQKPIFQSSEPTLNGSLVALKEQCLQGGEL